MELPTFTVEYTDGTSFTGESLRGDWYSIIKPIKSLKFSFGKITTLLTDFKSYNHLVEKLAIVGKKGEIITKYLIMGRVENQTYIFEYDLKANRARKHIVAIGQEYNGQLITGWKNGIEDGKPRFKHGNF